ncbi:unnamed protein product [Chironomus riparius]|uniref:Autophagy-related protein 27 n=1 Tax=Chironomus riparius TaxID=315576 RepID=A0A9N9S181_9DIPT|nr:unnamed protein product [Chironomus riparius]
MILISFTLILFCFLSAKSINAECTTQNICECVYSDGSGYSFKNLLNPVNSSLKSYAGTDIQIFFNPCFDSKDLPTFPENTTNDCKNGFTLCVYDSLKNHSFVLGTTKDTKFKEEGDQIFMTFGTTSNISSTVLLQCTPNSKTSTLYAPKETNENNTNLILFSNNACIKQIKQIEAPGFFSTFFLIAFIVLLTYLIIGIIYNYFFVGARGYELLPNYDFWCKLWISVKLGFYFVKNGFRVVPTEDSYDAI